MAGSSLLVRSATTSVVRRSRAPCLRGASRRLFWGRAQELAKSALSQLNGRPDELPDVHELFNFARPANEPPPKHTWKAAVTTDAAWGGRSTASFRLEPLCEGSDELLGIFEGEISRQPADEAEEEDAPAQPTPSMFSLFRRQHKPVPPAARQLGFAAVTFEQIDSSTMDCDEYDALVIKARAADDALYTVSLRGTAMMVPALNFQGFFRVRDTRGPVELTLPFTQFVSTMGGKLSGDDRQLDNARFTGIALSVGGDPNFEGPFRIVLDSIHARLLPDDFFLREHPRYQY